MAGEAKAGRRVGAAIVIEATLVGSEGRLRLSIHLQDGLTREERGMTVKSRAQAEREVQAFAARHPGVPVDRRGEEWIPTKPPPAAVLGEPAC